MNKIISVCIIISICLFFTATTRAADQGIQKEAAKLLEITDAKATINRSMEKMMSLQVRKNPFMAPYQDVLERFFNKYMNYESIKPELIKIYTQAFTEQELKDLNVFYQSATGRKSLQVMPQILAQSAQLAAVRLREHKEELEKMIRERAASFQKQEKK